MITEIPINESHIYALQISGKLEEKDYTTFRPKLERIIKKNTPLSLLIQLKDFEGWTAKAVWEDLKIGFDHDKDFLRIAIVGESTWEKLMVEFGNLFLDTEVSYFNDSSDAIHWLKEVKNLAESNEYIGYRHILVATDFSKYAETALKKAIELATPFDAKITLLHAAQSFSSDMYPYTGELAVPVLVNNPELEKKRLTEIKQQLLDQISDQGYSDKKITTSIEVGHPVDAITEFSRKNNVDLIVMGSHGRRGLARLVGSSTNGVINHSPCDVLTVV